MPLLIPGTLVANPLVTRRVQYLFQRIPTPAVGAAALVDVSSWDAVLVAMVNFRLVTSAVVASRFAALVWLDAGQNQLAFATTGFAQGANATLQFNFALGNALNTGSVSGFSMLTVPAVVIPTTDTLQISATGLDAGDQLSNITLAYFGIQLAGGLEGSG